jgi:pimeloyl-ACP methyl ester carboxylesterase
MSVRAHRLSAGSAAGPVVAFAHGMEDDWRSWRSLAERLDPDWRLYALELPWRAGADRRWRRAASPGTWLRTGLGLLEPSPDVVVGHSLGATAVLESLTLSGPGPAGAVLIAPFYRPPGQPITWQVFDRAKNDFEAIISSALEQRLGPRLNRLDPDIARSMLAKMVDRIGPVGFLTLFDLFLATADLELGEVTVPTLVMAGERDPALDGRRATALCQALVAGQVVVEPDFDHFCHVRQAAAVAAHLTAFVDKTYASRGEAR